MSIGKKDREYESIIEGCGVVIGGLNAMTMAAKNMVKAAESAEATLKDAAGKKDIEAVKELAYTILSGSTTAKDNVETLQKKIKKEYDEWIDLVGKRM